MIKLVKSKSVAYGSFGYKIVVKDKKIGAIYLDNDKKCLIIVYITISKNNRKRGYATKAMKKLISMMKHRNKRNKNLTYSCIKTTSIKKKNIASRKLWKSLGFTEKKAGKFIIAVKKL